MANILQVSNIPVRPDRNMPDGQKTGGYEESQQVHNPVDISRVVRADGQETEDAGNTASGNGYSVIDYESNYGAFIKKSEKGFRHPGCWNSCLPERGPVFYQGMQPGWENLWNR